MSDSKRPEPMFPVDLDSSPKMILGGKPWAVPLLAIRQNRVVVPALVKLLPMLQKLTASVANKATDPLWFSGFDLSTENFDLLSDMVYAALTRGYPHIARGEFDLMPISLNELLEAAPVVMAQTGTFEKKAAGDDKPGEAPATGTAASTSTSSSPTTANPAESPGPTS